MIRSVAGLLLGLTLLAAPLATAAQPPDKVYRIGFLRNSTATLEANLVQPFREGLRDLGDLEGGNTLVEYRWAGAGMSGFPPSSRSCSRSRSM